MNCQALSVLKMSALGKMLPDTFLKLLYSKPEVTAEINQRLLFCDQTTFQASFDRLTCLFLSRRGAVVLNLYWFPFLVADRTINLVHKCTHQLTSCVKVIGVWFFFLKWMCVKTCKEKGALPGDLECWAVWQQQKAASIWRMLPCGVFMRNKHAKCDAPNESVFPFFLRECFPLLVIAG